MQSAPLRDEFALAILTAHLVHPTRSNGWSMQQMVESSYKLADAMLKERERQP